MLAEKQQQKQQTPVKKKQHKNQILHHNHHNHENVINKMQAGDATPTKQPAKLVNGNSNHAAESTGRKINFYCIPNLSKVLV